MGGIVPPGTGGGGGGGLASAANVGVGTGLSFRDVTGANTLNIRTILGVGGISVTTVGNDITIDGSGVSGSSYPCAGVNDTGSGIVAVCDSTSLQNGTDIDPTSGCSFALGAGSQYFKYLAATNTAQIDKISLTATNSVLLSPYLNVVGTCDRTTALLGLVESSTITNSAYNVILGLKYDVTGNNNVVVGHWKTDVIFGSLITGSVSGDENVVLGVANSSIGGNRNILLGRDARTSNSDLTIMGYPIGIYKDVGGVQTDVHYNGAEVYFVTAPFAWTIINEGKYFRLGPYSYLQTVDGPLLTKQLYITEVGLIVSSLVGTLTTQPIIKFTAQTPAPGWLTVNLSGNIQTSLLDAVGKRQRWSNLAADEAFADVYCQLVTAASGSGLTITGRFYVRGFMVEKQ